MPDAEVLDALANPILNRPYDIPNRYFEMGPHGPTGAVLDGRRPSESFIPIAPALKGKKAAGDAFQAAIDFDHTRERRERNSLVNDLRREVGKWRDSGYERVTPITRKLLQHWSDETRENRVLFCQREAAETAIFLAEVAGRHGYTDWRRRLDEPNAEHNSGLPRVALKMATGSGKTVVMAMLIAWQTANKVQTPNDARFSRRFLVVAPGITIKDRLRVLQPSEPDNYYAQRDLVPPDLEVHVRQAQIVITNYHSFALKDAKEVKGVASATRKILLGGKKTDPFTETPDAMVARVLRDFAGTKRERIVVFNDEAHHCYQDRPPSSPFPDTAPSPRRRSRSTPMPASGSRDYRRSIAASASRRSMTCPRLPFTSVDPAGTRATSSRGWSATFPLWTRSNQESSKSRELR